MSFRADIEVSVGAVVESLTGWVMTGLDKSTLGIAGASSPPPHHTHHTCYSRRAAPYVIDLPISPTRRVDVPQKAAHAPWTPLHPLALLRGALTWLFQGSVPSSCISRKTIYFRLYI